MSRKSVLTAREYIFRRKEKPLLGADKGFFLFW
jgi:hypothetical protein